MVPFCLLALRVLLPPLSSSRRQVKREHYIQTQLKRPTWKENITKISLPFLRNEKAIPPLKIPSNCNEDYEQALQRSIFK